MAGGGGPPIPEGGGGKKAVDFQLNLIPFIDLLSVLISFLLMTSVWTQVAKIDVKQSPNQISEDPTPPENPEEKLNLTVLVKGSGYSIMVKGAVVKEIEKKGEAYDVATLSETLKQQRAEHPENEEVIVTVEDKVPYQDMITVMDIALEHKLIGISVQGVDT
ncbi:MAG: biopolymer transporter ExbD [Deltaproteobacteria bacterium]|nr:biopolymer transporter ExbD [Deltaproteobacteria bacterium]